MGGEKEEEEEEENNDDGNDFFCPPAGGRTDSAPAPVEGIWTCSPLSGRVSSTGCRAQEESIGTGGKRLLSEDEMKGGRVAADREGGRPVGGGDVSGGSFFLERKICAATAR